jgi:hypothetical protein
MGTGRSPAGKMTGQCHSPPGPSAQHATDQWRPCAAHTCSTRLARHHKSERLGVADPKRKGIAPVSSKSSKYW